MRRTVVEIEYEWRGDFSNEEANALHAQAFGPATLDASDWDWVSQCNDHSLGWVTARMNGELVGFVNVVWDGAVHAWIQDVMVLSSSRRTGIGLGLVQRAARRAKAIGCEWLHVDFDDHLRPFYFDAAGFVPTNGGLIDLTEMVDPSRE